MIDKPCLYNPNASKSSTNWKHLTWWALSLGNSNSSPRIRSHLTKKGIGKQPIPISSNLTVLQFDSRFHLGGTFKAWSQGAYFHYLSHFQVTSVSVASCTTTHWLSHSVRLVLNFQNMHYAKFKNWWGLKSLLSDTKFMNTCSFPTHFKKISACSRCL